MDMEKVYRVYNRCKYDIGVKLSNGQQLNITAGGFQPMKAMDIQYIDSICRGPGFFVTKQLVAVDDAGKEVPFEQVGLYEDKTAPVHHNDDEIKAVLRKSAKQIEAWLENIEDPVELDTIFMIAKDMGDLPMSKVNVLKNKMPDKDWLGE